MRPPKSELETDTPYKCLVSGAQDWSAYNGLHEIRYYLFVC